MNGHEKDESLRDSLKIDECLAVSEVNEIVEMFYERKNAVTSGDEDLGISKLLNLKLF